MVPFGYSCMIFLYASKYNKMVTWISTRHYVVLKPHQNHITTDTISIPRILYNVSKEYLPTHKRWFQDLNFTKLDFFAKHIYLAHTVCFLSQADRMDYNYNISTVQNTGNKYKYFNVTPSTYFCTWIVRWLRPIWSRNFLHDELFSPFQLYKTFLAQWSVSYQFCNL